MSAHVPLAGQTDSRYSMWNVSEYIIKFSKSDKMGISLHKLNTYRFFISYTSYTKNFKKHRHQSNWRSMFLLGQNIQSIILIGHLNVMPALLLVSIS